MYSTVPSTLARLDNPVFGRAFTRQPFRKDSEDAGVVITQKGEIYRLISLLGTGGLSVVYRAWRISDGQVVALKLADAQKAPESAEILRHEAEILSRLDHPNIVKVIDAGQTVDGDPFLALELLEGQTLEQLLVSKLRIKLSLALAVAIQIAEALHYAHQVGVLHRDIKPTNVIILPEGRVIVFDFGIAANLDGSGGYYDDATSSGSLIYAAPEQLMKKPLDARTDVYQLGLVLSECICGRLPFEISFSGALAYRRNGPLLPPNEELTDMVLPDNVREVLEGALQRDQTMRTANMLTFATALNNLLAGLVEDPQSLRAA